MAYTRFGTFLLHEVLPHIGKDRYDVYTPVWDTTFRVRMAGERMLLFLRQRSCQCCGLAGAFFELECSGCRSPHFNLYGVHEGREVLMTMDHIVPKSRGGITAPDNLQLLCHDCNALKKNDVVTLDELRARRAERIRKEQERAQRAAQRLVRHGRHPAAVPHAFNGDGRH